MTSGGLTMTEGWNLQLQAKVERLEAALQEALAEAARLEAELGLVKACVKLARANLKAGDALMADETLRPVLCGASPSPTAALIEAGRLAGKASWAEHSGSDVTFIFESDASAEKFHRACAAIIEKEPGDVVD